MFLDENFLLTSEWGNTLFHEFAQGQPIIDYHCHLDPKVLFENPQYQNLTQLWLNDNGVGDHYKWRLMRTNGVPESLISGSGDDYEKFLAFVKTIEKAPGNPIFEWSHLELKRFFQIDLMINQKNAPEIWRLANEKISVKAYRPQELVKMMRVKVICTTDDPSDSLKFHQELKEHVTDFKVLPTFRPDKAWQISSSGYPDYIKKLADASNQTITSFKELKRALSSRVAYFHDLGGRLADHGLNTFIYQNAKEVDLETLFAKAVANHTDFSELELAQYTTALQLHLMEEYTKHQWTLQMHLNSLRNDSRLMHQRIGIDVGGDSMGDQPALATNLVRLLAEAEERMCLPKMILYSLNPMDWLPLATAMQSFQGEIVQKLQLGCAWWFNDTWDGMRQQLTTMAQQSLLANFTGMLTDSRSLLSYPRHEYFRRVLCQLVGEWVESGRLPEDKDYLGGLIQDICYNNAATYFGF